MKTIISKQSPTTTGVQGPPKAKPGYDTIAKILGFGMKKLMPDGKPIWAAHSVLPIKVPEAYRQLCEIAPDALLHLINKNKDLLPPPDVCMRMVGQHNLSHPREVADLEKLLQRLLKMKKKEIEDWEQKQGDHKRIIRQILSNPNFNPGANKNLALKLAAKHGHTEIMKLLLQDKRVDPLTNLNLGIFRTDWTGNRAKSIEVFLQYTRSDLPADYIRYYWDEVIRNDDVELAKVLLRNMPTTEDIQYCWREAILRGCHLVLELLWESSFMVFSTEDILTCWHEALDNRGNALLQLILRAERSTPTLDSYTHWFCILQGLDRPKMLISMISEDDRISLSCNWKSLINYAQHYKNSNLTAAIKKHPQYLKMQKRKRIVRTVFVAITTLLVMGIAYLYRNSFALLKPTQVN